VWDGTQKIALHQVDEGQTHLVTVADRMLPSHNHGWYLSIGCDPFPFWEAGLSERNIKQVAAKTRSRFA
jgi:hypothetical protein